MFLGGRCPALFPVDTPALPPRRGGCDPPLTKRVRRATPPPLRYRRHSCGDDRVRFDDASPLIPDGSESRVERELCDAVSPMLRSHEEAGDPPQLARGDRRSHFSVRPSRIDPGEFLSNTVLTPTDRGFAFVYKDRVRATFADQRLLVRPVPLLPLLTRRPPAKGVRPLIEDAPTPALFSRKGLKVREGADAEFASRVHLRVHDEAFA